MNKDTANYINILSEFCGKRDINSLSKEELYNKYNINKADVMVLFGGSIICGGDVLAEAIKNNIADKYIIVGGAGHTTDTLRNKIKKELHNINTDNLKEAEMFNHYINIKYGLNADLLELKSTNCGNNITYLLELLKENNINFKSIIISQDSSMQYRMQASLRKHIKKDDILIINYAVYKAKILYKDNKLIYEKDILGMWNIEKYINLLMGEIQRLNDDEYGYGPKGKDFIIHVDIPDEVMDAFLELKKEYPDMIREANSLYA